VVEAAVVVVVVMLLKVFVPLQLARFNKIIIRAI
jgi:hypothetical protein